MDIESMTPSPRSSELMGMQLSPISGRAPSPKSNESSLTPLGTNPTNETIWYSPSEVKSVVDSNSSTHTPPSTSPPSTSPPLHRELNFNEGGGEGEQIQTPMPMDDSDGKDQRYSADTQILDREHADS